ncbi:MAG: hypothetical protein FJ255_02900 [Phycisphaerae bacterium]|nr:hypothetical protein [Phycisphaerae bacterium]
MGGSRDLDRSGASSLAIAGALALGPALWAVGIPVAAIVASAVLLGAGAGHRKGGLRMGAWLIGLGAGALLAATVGRAIEPIVASAAGTGGVMNRAVAMLIGGGVVAVALGAGLSALGGRLLASRAAWGRWDRRAGAAAGAAYGAALCLVVSWGLAWAEPIAGARLDAEALGGRPAPWAARGIARAAGAMRRSPLAGFVDATNPMQGSDLLALAADFVAVSRDPAAMEWFMGSDAMRRAAELESVRAGLAAVRGDAALSFLFEDGEVSVPDLVAVLNSETLLGVIDRTPVLGDLGPHAGAMAAALREARARVGPPR